MLEDKHLTKQCTWRSRVRVRIRFRTSFPTTLLPCAMNDGVSSNFYRWRLLIGSTITPIQLTIIMRGNLDQTKNNVTMEVIAIA